MLQSNGLGARSAHFLVQITHLQFSSGTEFVFNTFNATDLLLFGNATINSHTLSLTAESSFSIARALYPFKIATRSPNSSNIRPFSTSFIFAISKLKNVVPGHGLVFLFTPNLGTQGASSAQHLGLFNRTNIGDPNNHVFGVEFDVFKNQEFNDIDANHVGVDVNSLDSLAAETAGYWSEKNGDVFRELLLNNGANYQVWIDYSDFRLSVTMAPAGVRRPGKPLLNISIDLSEVLLDEMYVGFGAGTGRLVESHRILAWSFSNSNPSVGKLLKTSNLPSFVPSFSSKKAIRGILLPVLIFLCLVGVLFLTCLWILVDLLPARKQNRLSKDTENWELEYWPHRMTHQDIYAATNGFSEENVIGFGGNGKVYKGILGGVEVAVKKFAHATEDGLKGFLAEVSSLGRLKHRNLVVLRGWCKREKGSLILVYDYMENGSLDKRVFECEENFMLSWEDRIRVLKDVAAGVLYLHEGWEARVLHRDIKASNVLLDKEMNGRLGDFGLARLHAHGEALSSTRVIGTVGYMAPELVRTGRASAQTDVFGFGILLLEVVCGRVPVENGKPYLVDWLWGLMDKGELVDALDPRLKVDGYFRDEEVELVLHLGLLCTYADPNARPTMKQVVNFLEGNYDTGLQLEKMEACLLHKVETNVMWPMYGRNFRQAKHPAFSDFRQSLPSSDILVEGR